MDLNDTKEEESRELGVWILIGREVIVQEGMSCLMAFQSQFYFIYLFLLSGNLYSILVVSGYSLGI